MNELNVFLSSTFYDFSILREILSKKIKEIGHLPVLHEKNGLFYNPKENTHVSSLKSVAESDFLVLLIGSRFGGEAVPQIFNHIDIEEVKDKSSFKHFFSENAKYSITQCECLKAIECNIPIVVFVENKVAEAKIQYERIVKKGRIDPSEISFFDEDPVKEKYIFEFIRFIEELTENNAVKPFNSFDDIERYLKEYLSRSFRELIKNNSSFNKTEIEFIPEDKFPLETILDFFYEDSNSKKVIQSVSTNLEIKSNGDCNYNAIIKIKPIDALTHYHSQIFADKKGKMKVLEFKVLEAPFDSEYFGHKKATHLKLTLLFKKPKTEEFSISIKLKIENYISDLIEKGEGRLHRSLTNGNKEWEFIDEKITFDDIALFKNLKLKISKHPNPEFIGETVRHKKTNGKKIYNVVFKTKNNERFKKDTQIDFFLK